MTPEQIRSALSTFGRFTRSAPASELASGFGIYSGLAKGGVGGDVSAALNAGRLASSTGLLPPGANNILGPAGAAAGLVTGIQQGGAAGYTGAALDAAQLAGYASDAGLIGGAGTEAASFASGAAPFIGLTEFELGLALRPESPASLANALQSDVTGLNIDAQNILARGGPGAAESARMTEQQALGDKALAEYTLTGVWPAWAHWKATEGTTPGAPSPQARGASDAAGTLLPRQAAGSRLAAPANATRTPRSRALPAAGAAAAPGVAPGTGGAGGVAGGAAAAGALSLAAGAAMANPNDPRMTTQPFSPSATGMPDATSSADPFWLSSLSSDIGSFLSSPAGSLAEFGTLAAVGMSQASSQKNTNDQLAASLAKPGQPFTAAGTAELGQLTGGPAVGGPLGKSITQQTDAAANLGGVAKTYSTGQLTPAQNQQVQDFIKQQRAMIDTQLAASGNTDSSARDAAYQQIDNNAAKLTQELVTGNTQLAQGALSSVQSTYSNLLNEALASSEFGFSTQEAAVQTQIQSDTQLAQSLDQLFAGIAQGLGNAFSGGRAPGGGPVAVDPRGVSGSPAGGGAISSGNAGGNLDTTVNDPSTGQPFGATDPSTGLPFGVPPVDVSGDLGNVPPPDFNITDPFGGDPFAGGG